MPKVYFKNLSLQEFSLLSSQVFSCGYQYLDLFRDPKTKKYKISYTCPKHGHVIQDASLHLDGKSCRGCYVDRSTKRQTATYEDFIAKCDKKFNSKYSYSISVNKESFCAQKDFLHVLCKECGSSFTIKGRNHLFSRKGNCKTCQYKKNGLIRTMNISEAQTALSQNFTEFNYTIDQSSYKNATTPCSVICPEHGEYITSPSNFFYGHGGCPNCKKPSNLEKVIADILDGSGLTYSKNNRSIIKPNEIDFYLADYHLGIEACGLYWHSDAVVDKDYHKNKYNKARAAGVILLQLFEDEILNKTDIIKSMVLNKIGVSKSIYARKCAIIELDPNVKNLYLEKNHIQGACSSQVNLGLIHENELVGCMTFNKPRISLGGQAKTDISEWELVRYASNLNTRIIGGASKLLSFFEKVYSPKSIFTYANLRYSNGDLYPKLGFSFTHTTKPNYYYYKSGYGQVRYNRFKFRKSELHKLLPSFDSTLSEKDNMIRAGFLRVYDCGNLKFTKTYV